MYANAQADVAPTSSKTTPRSHVMSAIVMAETTSAVVKMRWRFGLKGEWGK